MTGYKDFKAEAMCNLCSLFEMCNNGDCMECPMNNGPEDCKFNRLVDKLARLKKKMEES